MEAAVTENQGAYAQAQATYETFIGLGLPEKIEKAELDLDAAKKTLDAQQGIFNNRQSLFREGAISRKDLEDADVALTQARNQYELARKHLEALRISNADAQKTAAGELQAAKGRYEAARARWGYAEIRSPIDGVVTEEGGTRIAGTPLITIMDVSRIVARTHIDQQQAAFLKPGDAATLAVPGVTDRVPAKVTLVGPALDPNRTTVELWAETANLGGRLRPGRSARVTFVAEKVKDALVIPAAALITASDGRTSVTLAGADGKPAQKPVKVGIRQDDRLQITDGFDEGARVVTQGAYEIELEDPNVMAKNEITGRYA